MQLSTVQLAKKLGIARETLARYVREGLKQPPLRKLGGIAVRLWGPRDIQRAKKFAAKRYRRKIANLREEE